MADFKIYDIFYRKTNNNDTHIAQHPKKWRQGDNEIWSVNRMYDEK